MFYPTDFTDDLRRKPICGVLAIAVAAGTSFAQATEAVKQNLLPHQKRHGGKTYHEQRLGALDTLGVKYVELPKPPKMTLARWYTEHAYLNKHYMVMTSAHIVTVKNGVLMDQQQCCALEHFNSRHCFVREVTEIV